MPNGLIEKRPVGPAAEAPHQPLISGGNQGLAGIPALKFANNALTVAIDVRANLHHRGAPITTGQRGQVWLWGRRRISTLRHASPLIPSATRIFSATGDWG
jgi:hypothetical protein